MVLMNEAGLQGFACLDGLHQFHDITLVRQTAELQCLICALLHANMYDLQPGKGSQRVVQGSQSVALRPSSIVSLHLY